jgi:hypothetical protein
MKNYSYNTTNLEITGFSATHIIFDDSNYATLWAKCAINNILQDVHLVFSFAQLNDLMRFNGQQGEDILLAMIDEMMTSKTPPYLIDLKKVLGLEPVFTTCKITLDELEFTPSLKDKNCYIVADLHPINIVQQAKNLLEHARNFEMPKTSIAINKILIKNTSLLQLKDMYKYYLGLIELDIKDDAAKEKANLLDDRLFAMAQNAFLVPA